MPEYLRETHDGLTLKAYRGDGCALLAFDIDPRFVDDLAGFAVEYDTPGGRTLPTVQPAALRRPCHGRDPASPAALDADRGGAAAAVPLGRTSRRSIPAAFSYRATAMIFRRAPRRRSRLGPRRRSRST